MVRQMCVRVPYDTHTHTHSVYVAVVGVGELGLGVSVSVSGPALGTFLDLFTL